MSRLVWHRLRLGHHQLPLYYLLGRAIRSTAISRPGTIPVYIQLHEGLSSSRPLLPSPGEQPVPANLRAPASNVRGTYLASFRPQGLGQPRLLKLAVSSCRWYVCLWPESVCESARG